MKHLKKHLMWYDQTGPTFFALDLSKNNFFFLKFVTLIKLLSNKKQAKISKFSSILELKFFFFGFSDLIQKKNQTSMPKILTKIYYINYYSSIYFV